MFLYRSGLAVTKFNTVLICSMQVLSAFFTLETQFYTFLTSYESNNEKYYSETYHKKPRIEQRAMPWWKWFQTKCKRAIDLEIETNHFVQNRHYNYHCMESSLYGVITLWCLHYVEDFWWDFRKERDVVNVDLFFYIRKWSSDDKLKWFSTHMVQSCSRTSQ